MRLGAGFWRRHLKEQALGFVLCLVCTIGVLRLWRASLGVPFRYDDDALVAQSMIKAMVEQGWYVINPHLGAPGIQNQASYPLGDGIHFLLLKLLSLLTSNAASLVNVFYLLTYPLVMMTALLALRVRGIGLRSALAASLLYTFLPYHLMKSEYHIFLCGYFMLPLMTLVFLDLAEQGERSELPAWLAIVIAFLTGGSGVYYAAFSLYFLVLCGWLGMKRAGWARQLVRTAVLSTSVMTGVVLSALPHLLARTSEVGPSYKRLALEGDVNGLRLASLVLPISAHRMAALANWAHGYEAAFRQLMGESATSALGILGAVGLFALFGRLLRPASRRAPCPQARDLEVLALLTLGAFVLGVPGGLGSVINYAITPDIRTYSRLSIFIGFFALFTTAVLLDRWQAHSSTRGAGRWAVTAMILVVTVVGLWDETSNQERFLPDYAALEAHYQSDRQFVEKIEAALPPEAMVYEFPAVPFPEFGKLNGMPSYDHLRLYLHSRRLRWSYGAMKGSSVANWLGATTRLAPEALPETLALAGFSGLYVDRRAFPDKLAREWEAKLVSLVGAPALESADGEMAFYNLVPYTRNLREKVTENEWNRQRELVLAPLGRGIGAGR